MSVFSISPLLAADQMRISPDAYPLFDAHTHPADIVRLLVAGQFPQDGLSMGLRLLPAPYAIAWVSQIAALCKVDAKDVEGLQIVRLWMQSPSEHHRQNAYLYYRHATHDGIGFYLCAAVAYACDAITASVLVPISPCTCPILLVAGLTTLAMQIPEQCDAQLSAWATELADVMVRFL